MKSIAACHIGVPLASWAPMLTKVCGMRAN